MNKMNLPEFTHSKNDILRFKEKIKLVPSLIAGDGSRYREAVKAMSRSGTKSVRLYASKIMYNNKVYTGYLTIPFISELFRIKPFTIYQRYNREGCCVYAMTNGMCIFCGKNLVITQDNMEELIDDILKDISEEK